MRKQKYRLAKKLEKNNLTTLDTHLSYKTPQALGKAISRVSQKLPSSPRKKTAVIKVLAKRAGVIPAEKSKKKSASCISEETTKFVKGFYTRSDIGLHHARYEESIDYIYGKRVLKGVIESTTLQCFSETHTIFAVTSQ